MKLVLNVLTNFELNVLCFKVRKLIAKNPSLCTIVEEGEEIGADEADEVDYANEL